MQDFTRLGVIVFRLPGNNPQALKRLAEYPVIYSAKEVGLARNSWRGLPIRRYRDWWLGLTFGLVPFMGYGGGFFSALAWLLVSGAGGALACNELAVLRSCLLVERFPLLMGDLQLLEADKLGQELLEQGDDALADKLVLDRRRRWLVLQALFDPVYWRHVWSPLPDPRRQQWLVAYGLHIEFADSLASRQQERLQALRQQMSK